MPSNDTDIRKGSKGASDNSLPLVSLVITSYNRAGFIGKAIESALAQDYPRLEIIVSDNCSTDNTDEVVSRYLEDPRLIYSVNDTNIGMLGNFEKATVQLASGKFITYVSSDDYLVNPTFISEAVARMTEHPNVVMVHSINIAEYTKTNQFLVDYSYLHYKDTFYKKPYVGGREVFMSYPSCHSISFGGTLLERERLLSLNVFEGIVLSGDIQVVLKLLLVGDAAFIDKKTYVARRHGGNATMTISKAQTYIDNLVYIDAPYRLALENKMFEEARLKEWRNGMYVSYLSQCMKYFLERDRQEYSLLSDFIRRNHPEVYRRIVRSIDWFFHRAMFSNRTVRSIYTSTRRLATSVTQTLKGRPWKVVSINHN